MKLVDLGHLDGLSERDRTDALSLIADGVGLNDDRAFGMAVGDKLYAIDRSEGNLSATFTALLALELGAIDRSLVPLPDDPLVWDAAYEEYESYVSSSGQPRMARHAVLELRSLRQSAGEAPVAVMISRTGLGILSRETAGWTLSHVQFAAMRTGLSDIAADLIDIEADGYSTTDVEALLASRDRDLDCAPQEHMDIGSAFYLALLCVERARTLARHPINAVAAGEATKNLIMPR